MSFPSVSIVILQHNQSQSTIRCLESIKELAGYVHPSVIIVDNASEPAELEHIKKYMRSSPNPVFYCDFNGWAANNSEFVEIAGTIPPHSSLFSLQPLKSRYVQPSQPKLLRRSRQRGFGDDLIESRQGYAKSWTLIANQSNLGYAGGNNLGLKYALAHGADYVFILNNDTTVEPDTLDKLMKAAAIDPLIGLVGPAIKEQLTASPTSSSQTVYHGRIKWLRPELEHVLRPPTGQYLKNKDYLPGAALLIKKEVFEKIGFFDEIFFLYFEDADFSFRAQLAGYKLKVIPEAVVFHWPSSSTRQLGPALLLRYHLRNALIFNSLNAPWTIKPLIIFWAGYLLAKNFLKIFIWPDTPEKAEALIDGILDFYQNRFGMIKK